MEIIFSITLRQGKQATSIKYYKIDNEDLAFISAGGKTFNVAILKKYSCVSAEGDISLIFLMN